MLINKNTEAFKNLDTTLRRIASDNNVSNVNSVSISQVPEGLILKFSYGEDDTIDFDVDVDEDLLVPDDDDVSVLESDVPTGGWEELTRGRILELLPESEAFVTYMFYKLEEDEDGYDADPVKITYVYLYTPNNKLAPNEVTIGVKPKYGPEKDVTVHYENKAIFIDNVIKGMEQSGYTHDPNFYDFDDELYVLLMSIPDKFE